MAGKFGAIDMAAFDAVQRKAGRGVSPVTVECAALISALTPDGAFAVGIDDGEKPASVRALIVRSLAYANRDRKDNPIAIDIRRLSPVTWGVRLSRKAAK